MRDPRDPGNLRDLENPLAPFLEGLPLGPAAPAGRSRRWLLRTLSAAAALLGLGSGSLACRRDRPEAAASTGEEAADPAVEQLAAGLEQHFSYLELDPQGVRAFAAEYLRHFEAPEAGAALPVPIAEKYLLSTDFFDNDGDETQVVHYVVFYDPYATPCSNRLAVLG